MKEKKDIVSPPVVHIGGLSIGTDLQGSLEPFGRVVGYGDGVAGAEPDLVEQVVGKVLRPELDVLEVLEDLLRQLLLLSVRAETLSLQDEKAAWKNNRVVRKAMQKFDRTSGQIPGLS